jgi:hypothetical protein
MVPYQAEIRGAEAQSALVPRIEQERRSHLQQLRLAQAVQQQKAQRGNNVRLLEKPRKVCTKSRHSAPLAA